MISVPYLTFFLVVALFAISKTIKRFQSVAGKWYMGFAAFFSILSVSGKFIFAESMCVQAAMLYFVCGAVLLALAFWGMLLRERKKITDYLNIVFFFLFALFDIYHGYMQFV